MAEIYVISDTHFYHENIIKYCGRPFGSAKEMNEAMVEKWNEVVKPQDKVYHLGDVYFGKGVEREEISSLLGSLQGKKRLILGNHDNGKDQLLQKHFQKIDVWRMFPEFGLLLTHVPVHGTSLLRGTLGNEEDPPRLLNIHGHIHDRTIMEGEKPHPDYLCVCVEHIEYRPINIEELRKC